MMYLTISIQISEMGIRRTMFILHRGPTDKIVIAYTAFCTEKSQTIIDQLNHGVTVAGRLTKR